MADKNSRFEKRCWITSNAILFFLSINFILMIFDVFKTGIQGVCFMMSGLVFIMALSGFVGLFITKDKL